MASYSSDRSLDGSYVDEEQSLSNDSESDNHKSRVYGIKVSPSVSRSCRLRRSSSDVSKSPHGARAQSQPLESNWESDPYESTSRSECSMDDQVLSRKQVPLLPEPNLDDRFSTDGSVLDSSSSSLPSRNRLEVTHSQRPAPATSLPSLQQPAQTRSSAPRPRSEQRECSACGEQIASRTADRTRADVTRADRTRADVTRAAEGADHTEQRASSEGCEQGTWASDVSRSSNNITPTDKKIKKKKRWVLSPNYKSRSEDFKKNFRDLVPGDERLVVDYACALQKEILLQGRMYISQRYICFYANIFTFETTIAVRFKDIHSIRKEKTARFIPNAILITHEKEKTLFFTSFAARDKVYNLLYRIWKNAQHDQPMPLAQLWRQIHALYGEDLGLTSSDDDYIHETEMSAPQNGFPAVDEVLISTTTDQPPEVGDVGQMDTSLCNGCSPQLQSSSNGGDIDPLSNRETDTTESEPDSSPVSCSCDHIGQVLLNEVYNFPVNRLVDLILTDSQFFTEFTRARKWKDIRHGEWTRAEGSPASGLRHRTLSYSLPTNTSLAPKMCCAVEQQEEIEVSNDAIHIVESTVTNSGVPYADYFHLVNRYCLTRAGASSCRLRVTNRVVYRKTVWSLIKSFIDKNIMHGVKQHFNALDAALQEEANQLGTGSGSNCTVAQRVQSQRRRARARTLSETASGVSSADATVHLTDTGLSEQWSVYGRHALIAFIVLIVLLLLLNLHLYWRVSTLESLLIQQAQTRYFSQPQANDWSSATEADRLEQHKWKTLVDNAVQMLDQTRASLVSMSKNIPSTGNEQS